MKKILTLFFSFMFVVGLSLNVQAKDVDLDQTTVDATIHEDGTVTITETWVVDFDGRFSKFEREIPINPNETIDDFYIAVNGQPSVMKNSGQYPGTYSVNQNSDEVVLDIHMLAQDEEMTFTIQYDIAGAIHRYQDVAEFNYNMIGSEWAYSISEVSGTITFPAVENREDDIHVWGHGPANGRVDITSNQSVFYQCDELPEYTALNIRLLLPSQMFTSLPISSNQSYLDEIIETEAGYAREEANRQNSLKRLWIGSGVVGLSGSLAGIFYVFRKRRKILKAVQPAENPEYYRDIPSDLTPSEVVDLLNYPRKKYDDENKFGATLMSLCLYGLLEFETYEKEGLFKNKQKTRMIITFDQEKANRLKVHEKTLYDFIVKVAKDDVVSFDDIERYTKRAPKYCQKKMDAFLTGSEGLMESNGYYDLNVKRGSMYFVSILLIVIGGVILFGLPLAGAPLIVAGLISLFMTISAKRYSQKGADEVALWQAFERFLKEFTLMDEKELPELVMWEEYLVYAVALGIGEKVLKQLPLAYPDFYESDFYTHSYIRCFYYHGNVNLRVFDDIKSFSSDMKTAVHYTENSGGHGGSFSSGGGGFAGGGHSSGGGGGSFS